jgi:hypothetical protein
MELSGDTSFKIKFESLPLIDFWIYIGKEYVENSQLTIDVLLRLAQYTCFKKCFGNDSN